MNQIKSYMALFTTIFLWSSALVAIRFAVQSYHPGSMALLRLLAGSVAVSYIVFTKHSHQKLNWKDIAQIYWLGFLINTVYQTSLNFGELTVAAGIGGFIISTIPIYTTIGAVFLLKEPMHKLAWLGVLISFSGIVLIAIGEAENFQFDFGVIYILISALAASIYILSAKPLLKKVGALRLTAYLVWSGTLFLLIFSPGLYRDIQTAPMSATLVVIYLGFFPTAVAYATYNYALNNVSLTIAANWLYAIPLMTCILAWLFLGEIPTMTATIGGFIALSGTILVSYANKPKKPKIIPNSSQ